MTKDKTYEPFDGFKRISTMWENQLNGLLYMMTDNNEFVRLLKAGTDTHSRYMELLRKNQELMAGVMNIPTKKDVANVAKLSVQAEEKIDILEEQIWNLQDSIALVNKENVGMLQEMVTVVKQMKDEVQKLSQEMAETKKVQSDLVELKQGIVDIKIIQINLQELRKEINEMKGIKANLIKSEVTEEMNAIQKELLGVKEELTQVTDIKDELAKMKNLIQKGKVKDKEKDKELVLSASTTSKL
jgi:DNA repair exonuclease SbcCD ATPase subunit